MPIKTHTIALLLLIFSFNFITAQNIQIFPDKDQIVMCSSLKAEAAGTCYGKANCTACSSCNYCAHCNSGGSCGVCDSRLSKRNYTSPASKTPVNPPTYKYTAPARRSPKSNATPNKPLITLIDITGSAAEHYLLTQSTSLRQASTHKSSVLKRFVRGDQVVLLEKTNQFWWKVEHKGKTGWVKRLLLKKKE